MLFDYMLVYDYSFYLSGVLLMAAGLVMVIPWRYTHAWERQSSLYRPDDAEEAGTSSESSSDDASDRARRKDAEAGRAGTSDAERVEREQEQDV